MPVICTVYMNVNKEIQFLKNKYTMIFIAQTVQFTSDAYYNK